MWKCTVHVFYYLQSGRLSNAMTKPRPQLAMCTAMVHRALIQEAPGIGTIFQVQSMLWICEQHPIQASPRLPQGLQPPSSLDVWINWQTVGSVSSLICAPGASPVADLEGVVGQTLISSLTGLASRPLHPLSSPAPSPWSLVFGEKQDGFLPSNCSPLGHLQWSWEKKDD